MLLKAGKTEVPAGSLTVKVLLLFLSCRLISVSSSRDTSLCSTKWKIRVFFIRASNSIQNVRILNFTSKGHSVNVVVSGIHFNTFVFLSQN